MHIGAPLMRHFWFTRKQGQVDQEEYRMVDYVSPLRLKTLLAELKQH